MLRMILLRLLCCMVSGGLPNVGFDARFKLRGIFLRTLRDTSDPPRGSRIFAIAVPKLLKILYFVTHP